MNVDILLKDILDDIHIKYPYLEGIRIKPSDLIFEERVKLLCFNCGKYNNNWKCPPIIPQNIDYHKVFCEYNNAAFIWLKLPITPATYNDVRNDSSIFLHKALLDMEKYLWDRDNPTALSFIGGSCKICKNGCGKDKCNNPYRARSPLESTGVNILKSAAKYGIKITFPPTEYMMRLGLLLW
jgi:predicted metal-binding protein